MDGGLVRRLRDQVIEPARRKGYRDIWLSGASQGGMGSLFYERTYPGEVTGLVLLAPYMGEDGIVSRVAEAGGPARWQPPLPKPPGLNINNYQVEIWRAVHAWHTDSHRADEVWVACGADDDFLPAAKMIASVLPAGHFIELPGGHDWKVWDRAATQIFAQVAKASTAN
ncbi:MAG TPA: alpha/beta hydrolase-fold protein, partial [Gammaproteobacteria bacterium]|nr:alpha/beta hydrolase-fold protein [Gammaproteobacteria bacterium]